MYPYVEFTLDDIRRESKEKTPTGMHDAMRKLRARCTAASQRLCIVIPVDDSTIDMSERELRNHIPLSMQIMCQADRLVFRSDRREHWVKDRNGGWTGIRELQAA